MINTNGSAHGINTAEDSVALGQCCRGVFLTNISGQLPSVEQVRKCEGLVFCFCLFFKWKMPFSSESDHFEKTCPFQLKFLQKYFKKGLGFFSEKMLKFHLELFYFSFLYIIS